MIDPTKSPRASPSKATLVVVLAAALVTAILAIAVRRHTTSTADTTRSAAAPNRPAPALAPRLPSAAHQAPDAEHVAPALPSSLRETEIDGWIGVDDNGHLVVTPGARWFFDYFLSAVGEESEADIRARIVAEIERRLPPQGAHEAVALLDRYLTYREHVRDAQEGGTADDLGQRLAALHQLRVDVFGASDAAILFGEEEQVQAADLERRAIMGDTTVSPEERERRLAAIEERLPAAIRAARADTFAPLHLLRDEQALREAGGSLEDIHALRAQRFGDEAANRLAVLDREHAAWQQRLDDYNRARALIAADTSLDDRARVQARDALIAQRFTPEERLRVEAFDSAR